MKKPRSTLAYPVTIRQIDRYLVFSVKDLNISLVEELPENGQLSPEFMLRVHKTLAKTWIKSYERLKDFRTAGKTPPSPSLIRVATKDIKKSRPLTAPRVAKILGISENSVRRIPKSKLRYYRTKGGHRRYSVGALELFQEAHEDRSIPIPNNENDPRD